MLQLFTIYCLTLMFYLTGLIPPDYREPEEAQGAVAFGCIGLALVIGFVVLVVIADLDIYYRGFRKMKCNVTSWCHDMNQPWTLENKALK